MPKAELIKAIAEALRFKERFILAVDGMAGSGKSRLAIDLAERLHGQIVRLDHFFLPFSTRDKAETPAYARHMDLARFKEEVSAPLVAREDVSYRVFSCQLQRFVGTRALSPSGLIIIEGSYALHPDIVDLADATVFLEVSPKIQRDRLKKREGDHFSTFEREWLPREKAYHEALLPRKRADYVIDTTKANETILYLVRHGVTSGNIDRVIQGQYDVDLASEGIAQAKRLAVRLADYHIDRGITSDLLRARKTADIILGSHEETALTSTEALREIHMGEMQGQSYDYCKERYSDVFTRLKEDPMGVRSPGGETGQEVLARGKAFLQDVLLTHKTDVLLAVSHGYILNLLVQSFSQDEKMVVEPTVFSNTALSKLVFAEDRLIEIPFLNDSSHLK